MSHFSRWLHRPSIKISLFVFSFLAILLPNLAGAAMLRDGVILDTAKSVAYMMTDSGIDAVDLTAGTVLWSSAEPGKPLAIFEGLLIAQATATNSGRLPIIGLDLTDGSRRDLAEIELPDELWASMADGPTTKFRTHANIENGELHISWLATRLKAQGQMQGYLEHEDGAIESAPTKAFTRLQGAARLDLTSGQASPVAEAKLASLPAPRNLDLAMHKPLKGVSGRQYTSADGRHILASERIAGNSEWNSYRWTIYDRRGTRLGMVDNHLAVAPFEVIDNTLLYESRPSMRVVDGEKIEQPLQLKAVDLVSGAELWSKSLASTEYTGPYAP